MIAAWRKLRLAGPVALLALLTLLAASCGGGRGQLTLSANFDDVQDLTEHMQVKTGDVPIGSVTGIELTDDYRARVTMQIKPDTGLPANVEAVLRQTSPLGERFVDLVPAGPGGRLASGFIQRSRTISDLEAVTGKANEVLASVAADRLNIAVRTGATALGGRGNTLGQALSDVERTVQVYDQRKDEVTRLLDGVDSLLGTIASAAETNAGALDTLASSSRVLEQQDDRLINAMEQLRNLAVVGGRILRDNQREFSDVLRQTRVLLEALTKIDGALEGVLVWLPRHDLHVPNGQFAEHAQVWIDFIMCGTPDEDRNDPSQSCVPTNPGRSNDPPPGHAVDTCDTEHRACPYPPAVEPGVKDPHPYAPPSPRRHGGGGG